VRTGLNYFLNVDTLAWHRNFKFFWGGGGKLDPFVNYFVKIKPNGYHKIVLPAPTLVITFGPTAQATLVCKKTQLWPNPMG
jgi:hypothetical protein